MKNKFAFEIRFSFIILNLECTYYIALLNICSIVAFIKCTCHSKCHAGAEKKICWNNEANFHQITLIK